MPLFRLNRVVFLLFCCYVICIDSLLWANRDQEAEFFASLLPSAYQGKWHLMNNKALPYEGFTQKNGKQWLQGEKQPYTGWYAQYDENNSARLLSSFFDGIRDGPVARWDATGNLVMRGVYLGGKKHGVFTGWSRVGIRIFEKEYVDGKLDGWNFFWYDNGQIRLRLLFESGKLIEASGWLANGVKCPHTRVEKGSGIIIHHDDGAKLPSGIAEELKTKKNQKSYR